MENEKKELSSREKQYVRMKSIMDYGMGGLWLGMGSYLLFFAKYYGGFNLNLNDPVVKGFGAVCILYGVFRLYRGYKKNYFKS
jgi:hypothetical protein